MRHYEQNGGVRHCIVMPEGHSKGIVMWKDLETYDQLTFLVN